MNRRKSKQLRRQAEDWCFEALKTSFPEEVTDDMNREDLWKFAFPETHYRQKFQNPNPFKVDEDGDPLVHERMRLFRMSPRWIYKELKKNPSVTREELKRKTS